MANYKRKKSKYNVRCHMCTDARYYHSGSEMDLPKQRMIQNQKVKEQLDYTDRREAEE